MEAEQFTVSPDDESSVEPDAGIGIGDVATELSSQGQATPVAPGGVGALQIGQIPQPSASAPTTISKIVVNTDILLSLLSELKSVISTYEKKFEGEDLGVDDAKVYVASLLNTLIYHAQKLQEFASIDSGAAPVEPTAPVVPPAPTTEPAPIPAPGV